MNRSRFPALLMLLLVAGWSVCFSMIEKPSGVAPVHTESGLASTLKAGAVAPSFSQVAHFVRDNRRELVITIRLTSNAIAKSGSISGAIELTNVSTGPLTIVSLGDPRQYVEFLVLDEKGNNFARKGYGAGHCRHPDREVKEIIPPGETWDEGFNLYSVIDVSKLTPGKYSVQAVFSYENMQTRSKAMYFSVTR